MPANPSKRPSARNIALKCLRAIDKRRGFSNRILDEQLERSPQLDPRDRGLVTNLVYGALRHQSRLDQHIDAVAKKPSGLKGEIRTALRIATYELIDLSRPLPIASSECARAIAFLDRRGALRPLIGGILSAIDQSWRAREQTWTSAIDQLCFRYSIPDWLAQKWLQDLGADTALARARASAKVPWIDLRVDPSPDLDPAARSAYRQQIAKDLAAHYPQATIQCPEEFDQCIRIQGAGDIFYGPLYEQGQISIQSLGSQQAALALQARPGERILDACCGMGTKSAQIALSMQGQGQLIAADQSSERLSHLPGQFTRLQLGASKLDLRPLSCDLTDPKALNAAGIEENLDAALLDAPCSGLGNLARHPELRWTRSPQDLPDRVALQRALISSTLARLRPGGRLLYAVCSLEVEEGPQNIAWALAQTSRYRLTLEEEACFTPETQHCDGFYLARLRLDASQSQ